MIQDKRNALLSGLALAATLVSGCVIQADGHPSPIGEGTLTMLWTVDGTTDPDACYDLGGGPIDFELLIDEGTEAVADVQAPCEDFGLSVNVRPGTYTGYATLVDMNDDAVTTTLPLERLVIVEDTELTVDVDFPLESFIPF
jgi:hypothetical protein